MRHILGLLSAAGRQCCVNGYVVSEARRNLEAKSPGGEAELERLLKHLSDTGIPLSGPALDEIHSLPEKDRPVLAAAIAGRCDVLLTGDRAHFGRWFGKKLAGVAIHSPCSLAETILK